MKSLVFFWAIFILLSGPSAKAAQLDAIIEGAKKEKKIMWWTTASASEARGLIKGFNQRYPFLQVEYWNGTGEDIAEKIWAEFRAKRHVWDVSLGAEMHQNYGEYVSLGIIKKWSVAGLAALPKQAKDPNGYWAILGGNVTMPAYNTNFVSPREAPKSWEDLLDPKWKGQLGITIDPKVWLVLAQPDGWGIEKTRKYITRLAASKPQLIRGHTYNASLLVAGEYPIAINVRLNKVLQLKEQGAPVEWVRVNPVVFTGSAFSLSNHAPHPNAAYLLLDWMYSPEGVKAVDEATRKGNPFPGSGSRQSEATKGLSYVARDAAYFYKNREFGKELQQILGVH